MLRRKLEGDETYGNVSSCIKMAHGTIANFQTPENVTVIHGRIKVESSARSLTELTNINTSTVIH